MAIFALVVDYYNNTVGLQNFYISSLSAIFRNTAVIVFAIELIKFCYNKQKSRKDN